MITLRAAAERGHADHGWLDSFHTFSFAGYQDPRHMGFRSLRVINEDRVQPGRGFGTHPHRDMEIVSYVLEGELEHWDSMGNGGVIRPGEVQRMTAGTGITHSEANASRADLVHFLQIWLLPVAPGVVPSYEQKMFSPAEKAGRLRLVGSSDGRDGSVTLHADAALYAGLFTAGQGTRFAVAPARHAYVHVARGRVRINGHDLSAGDAATFSDEPEVSIEGVDPAAAAEVLLFDLG